MMTEDSSANNRRPSIATIFNPRRVKSGIPPIQNKSKHVHPRPSVVVTDEDTPNHPLTLTNGAGDTGGCNDVTTPTDSGGSDVGNIAVGGCSSSSVGNTTNLGLTGVGSLGRDRCSTVSDRGVSLGLGTRNLGSRASAGSINVIGSSSRSLTHQHSTGVRHARSPSINLASSVPSTDNDPGGSTFSY